MLRLNGQVPELAGPCGPEPWYLEVGADEDPVEVIGDIAPTPIVLVHGRDDHFFDEEQAWLLYRRANPPKRLLLASRFGHAEDGYTPAFAWQISAAIEAALR